MNRGKTLDSIPTDILLEIFSRLTAKSIGRCRCVSKLWASLLARQDFTELFLTSSSARPRLLFAVEQYRECSFYSSPQLQNPNEKSSLIVAADFHSKFLARRNRLINYASGLIYFADENRISQKAVRVICNPLTGKYAILPELYTELFNPFSYLGFDPINKQFKVFCLNDKVNELDHHILTLGAGNMKWRRMECPVSHMPFGERICINGVLYYYAIHRQTIYGSIVCFDVRSEKFKFVEFPVSSSNISLINCKGKLGGTCLSDNYLELSMWVLEDVDKQEWSKHVYSLRDKNKAFKGSYDLSVVGMTASGEIVLAKKVACKPFYVFYFNPEKSSLQSVEIQGLEEAFKTQHCSVYTFVDYEEDLRVDDAMQLKSSTVQRGDYVEDLSVNDAMQLKSRPVQRDQNIVTEILKPQQRRHTSNDLCNSVPCVKNKQQNTYELLALFGLFIFSFLCFLVLSSTILLA